MKILAKKSFLAENFLLDTSIAEKLYFGYAEALPIIDYHNHLSPEDIANDRNFETITRIWLDGDHYKWRAMRALGISEEYITGQATDQEKFEKWAETVPQTLRNPLYHWTHLELQRTFGIKTILNPDSAKEIYNEANSMLNSADFSVRSILGKMNVEVVCTTDDPLNSLRHHQKLAVKVGKLKVYPTWRPDRATAVENSAPFTEYINALSEITDRDISSLDEYLESLTERHSFFHSVGCRLSDHGLNQIPTASIDSSEARNLFLKRMQKSDLTDSQVNQLKLFLLRELARLDHHRGWVQQFHLGAMRNVNSTMIDKLGADTGFDSIGDYPQAEGLASFFDDLESSNQLAKTIVYNLNPGNNEVIATMLGNFNRDQRGKMQFGSGWWYLDQLDGMEKQINTLSNMGLLSCFVGMLTDSRSFLSFPRHEYFRRLLCNIVANDIDRGLVPEDYQLAGKLIQDICYFNARNYFKFHEIDKE